jgi:hypothetical protein
VVAHFSVTPTTDPMHTLILSLAATALLTSATPLTFTAPSPGGPPRVTVAGRTGGDIHRVQWMEAKAVGLQGCVAGLKVTALTLHIIDCKGGPVTLKTTGAEITKEMRLVVNNLPAGTAFTLKVEAMDGSGRKWEVPEATFTWRA